MTRTGTVRTPAIAAAVAAAVVAAVVAAAHLLLVALLRATPGVILWTDGAGYLANARWLAPGVHAPDLDVTPFYHAGYSLLLAPVYALTTDPGTVYRSALVVNALAAGAGAVLLWRLATAVFGLRGWRAVLAAGLASTYPAVLLQSGFEWAESLLFTVVALWALALWAALRRATSRSSVALGAAGAGTYLVHPRAVGLVLVTALVLAAAVLRGRLRWRVGLAGAATLVGTLGATEALHAALRAATRAPDAPGAGAGLAARLLDPGAWGDIALRAAGQGWYLLVASAGLTAAGVVVLVAFALGRADRDRAWFALAVLAGIALTGAVGAAGVIDPRRVDHHVYGRYLEVFAPLLLVAAAAAMLRPAGRWRVPGRAATGATLAAAAAAAVVLGLVTSLGYGPDAFTGDLMPLNVLGVLVWSGDRTTIDLPAVTLGAGAVTVVVAALVAASRRTAALAVLALTGGFALAAGVVQARTLDPFVRQFGELVTIPQAVKALEADLGLDGPQVLSVDLADRDGIVINAYAVELPDHRVELFDSRRGEGPAGELVIGSKRWGGRQVGRGAALLYPETARDQALWAVPGPIAATAAPVAPDTAGLDDGFFAGSVRHLGGGEILLEHPGSNVPPWVRWGALTGVPAVRLAVRWYPVGDPARAEALHTHLVDLPHTLGFGARSRVRVALAPGDDPDRPLPPGRYTAVIAPQVDGTWFPDRGGPQVVLTVTVPGRPAAGP